MTRTDWGLDLQRKNWREKDPIPPSLANFPLVLWEYFNVAPDQPREEEEGDDESMSPEDWDNASECPWGPDNDFDHYYEPQLRHDWPIRGPW